MKPKIIFIIIFSGILFLIPYCGSVRYKSLGFEGIRHRWECWPWPIFIIKNLLFTPSPSPSISSTITPQNSPTPTPETICPNAMTTIAINDCLVDLLKNQDAILTQIIAQLKSSPVIATDPDEIKTLTDSQSTFLKYRENQCYLESIVFKDGTARNSEYVDCAIHLTKDRIRLLTDLYNQIKDRPPGMFISPIPSLSYCEKAVATTDVATNSQNIYGRYTIDNSTTLILYQCAPGAYQSTSLLYLFKNNKYQLLKLVHYENSTFETTHEVIGLVNFDEQSKTLSVFTKSAGHGGCGSSSQYQFINNNFKLTKLNAYEDCDHPQIDNWPEIPIR